MDAALFDRDFLRKLESLAFVSRRIYRGEARGAHASVRRGTSLDFADFRTYQPGDDFRTIDWGIYGRLDRLFVRLYAEEEDLTVHLLLDASASMSFGSPPKIDYARRLAAALGYVGHRLAGPGGCDDVRRWARQRALRRTRAAPRPRPALPPPGVHERAEARRAAPTSRGPWRSTRAARAARGSPSCSRTSWTKLREGYRRGLQALLFHDFEVVLVHVLDREEIGPGGAGRAAAHRHGDRAVAVRSTWTGRCWPPTGQSVTGFFGEVESFCLKNRIEYLRTATIVPFEDVVLRYLRQGAHLHAR